MKAVTITRLVLEKILECGEATMDIFFPPQYSYARLSRRLFGLDSHPTVAPRTFAAILSRLKYQGLVVRRGRRGLSSWSITQKGARWLKKNYEPARQPLAKDGRARLVIFDIPERERKKRDALRFELLAYNFKQLQKSVWIGYNPLPNDFIELLDHLRLKNHVHIFGIKERGTLE